MSWTQPVCMACFKFRSPGREPVCVKAPYANKERCCNCGVETDEGIYIRIDPTTIRWPRKESEGL